MKTKIAINVEIISNSKLKDGLRKRIVKITKSIFWKMNKLKNDKRKIGIVVFSFFR